MHWAFQTAQRAGVVTADTPAGRKFAAFGRGSMAAFPPGSVFGERWIMIGEGTLIAAQVSLSAGMVPGQDLGPVPVLRIGDRCVIGRGSHIVAHHSLVIEDDVFTGPYVYITDQNHGYADPDVPIGRQMPQQRRRPHRLGQLARGRRGGAARRVHRPQRGHRGRLGGARHGAGPVRGGGRPGPGGQVVRARRRLAAPSQAGRPASASASAWTGLGAARAERVEGVAQPVDPPG